MAFTSKKLIDVTSNQLNRDTWHTLTPNAYFFFFFKKKKEMTPNYSFPWTTFMDKEATDGVLKMHKSYFVHMGCPWEKIRDMGCVKHAHPW